MPTSGELEVTPGLFALEADRTRPWARVAREVWHHLPAWMFFFYGCLLLHGELTAFTPAAPELAPTVLFPLTVFCGYYVARALWAPDVARRRLMLVATVGLAFGLPTLEVVYHPSLPLSESSLQQGCQALTVIGGVLLAVHAWRRARSTAWLCFGVGLAYGALVQGAAVLLGFLAQPRLAATTAFGWSLVLYMAFFVARGLRGWGRAWRRSVPASTAAVVLAVLLMDLQLDPAAAAARCWRWAPGLPPVFHGVPLAHFVGCASAVLPFAYYAFRFQRLASLSDRSRWTAQQLRLALVAVPAMLGVAAALFLGATLVLEGPRGPSFHLLYGAADRLLAWL
jgi:uncharacterized membrane protein